MNEKSALIGIHVSLFLLQIIIAGLAIVVNPQLSTLAVPLGVAQAYFPNPFANKAV
jgi:hypothetical protein